MEPFRIGVVGLGTVGGSLVRLLAESESRLNRRSRRPLSLRAVSARDRARANERLDISDYRWFDSPFDLAQDGDLDVVVELIGGAEGAAREVVQTALSAGKHVVTANKDLLARHGAELAKTAEANGVNLFFEAAVGGAVPCVEALRDGLVADRIFSLRGILNGTCNYILTGMEERGVSRDEALKSAQELGYAEADPSFDIGGQDSAHKLALLSALCFGELPALSDIHIEGIESLDALDFRIAEELGYRIRLAGVSRPAEGGLLRCVYPCLLPRTSMLARVFGPMNAVEMRAEWAGAILLQGQGAGGPQTASAVASDLVRLGQGGVHSVFGWPLERLEKLPSVRVSERVGGYYVRFEVRDEGGILAAIGNAFHGAGLSFRSLLQRGRWRDAETGCIPVVLTVGDAVESAVTGAVAEVERHSLCRSSVVLRIEES
ncbi:MAG: homoserine dehydrogenase [Alphaproteobacteria bacterium]|nr:homoserine dehydrogenase [Alphaproteobacteria bacterium]MDA8005377.1 homoserine dehydrogenase [Alphaproteobacteria bacterium]MDA8013412.1 homoserine dehydrogenase [Alphaproteobacteria bacterium]